MKPIRTAARAFIVEEGRLLVIAMRDERGLFYILPGGGQLHGETLKTSLKREVFEETGAQVDVGELLYVREYIGRNHTFARRHRHFHQLEVVFRCKLAGKGVRPGVGEGADKRQVGIDWLDLAAIHRYRFYPEVLKSYVKDGQVHVDPIYMGDIN